MAIFEYLQLAAWVATVTGLYYKMRADINSAAKKAKTDNDVIKMMIKTTNEKIKEIEKDREKRWDECYNHKDKVGERLDKQCSKLSQLAIGIKEISVNVKWLKNQKK